MLLPNRHANTSDYRYGFNGMELDDELKGEGNSYDFGNRMHDPRIGRFLSIDPKWREFESTSPYSFANNNPLLFIDKDGENPIIFLVLLKGVGFVREHITSRNAAMKVANFRSVSEQNRDQIMQSIGILDGILSTIDVSEFEESQKELLNQWWESKPFEFDTFGQKSSSEIQRTVLGPEGISAKEQASQIISIIENWDDLDSYSQGQVEGVIIGTLAQAAAGGKANIRIPKLKLKLSKNFNIKFKSPKLKSNINKIPDGKEANHIFSKKDGKFSDTPDNRKLIEDLTNDENFLLGKDQYDKEWYSKELADKTQIYAYT